MSKDPAILFYTADFRQGTILMTDEQVGQYIRLLCDQHQNGHLPDSHMLNICKTYDSPVFAKFEKDDNKLWFNSRLDEVIDKRLKYSESRRNNRLSKTHDKDMSLHMSNHMSTHMENGNGNTNRTVKLKKENKRGIIKGEFGKFWEAYPKKVGKGAAVKAYAVAIGKATAFEILTALQIQTPYLSKREKQYIPNASTWLNQERWLDDIESLKDARNPETNDIINDTFTALSEVNNG